MKEFPLTYWLTVKNPMTDEVVWQRPINGFVKKNENGDTVGIQVVEAPYGHPPSGNYKIEIEPAWQVVETRPEKLIDSE